ncbi:glycosyltransferase family 31 protein [Coniochaeta ligniaria NRRL 30616]|uniref:Glycosyltransferase family 31 protein n=1 Tax=Coniochaeta ligniaria NRRL 30616 TaxID=1408157 RepID=A0A1J7I5N2_9PEZI|nr:glycosyltransferase family 31 protein [Coniochaeta ligniaria NRRL 30616]
MPAPVHRCFNMRNPVAKAVVLSVMLLFLLGTMLRSDSMDVKKAIVKTANAAKASMSTQEPLDKQDPEILDRPAEDDIVEEQQESEPATPVVYTNTSHAMNCDYDMEKMLLLQDKWELDSKFEYTKRYVRISRQNIKRKSITKLNQKFLPENPQVVDLTKQAPMSTAHTCEEPLVVPVTQSPYPNTANASDFIFGVSTTYKRFKDPRTSSIHEWTYWLTDGKGKSNGGKLVLLLLDASEEELLDAWKRLDAAGIDVDVYQSDSSMEMAVRYLTLVPTLYNHPDRPGRKWVVTCDDDTFFPSFNALAARFEEYDHTMPMYIGTLSEDVNNVDRHGAQAFGGGGVFLSIPLAKVIAEKFDSCKTPEKIKQANTGWGPQGDVLLRKCIYENSEAKLTTLWDLWQLDIYGDPSGFYESGIAPLSLHHYRGGGWHVAHPWQYTKIAHLCGEDCTLQRFKTKDNYVISNGFSVAYYPKGIDFNFNQLERTFHPAPEDKGWNMDYMLGPQRPSLATTGRKMSWDGKETTINPDGSVSQIYVRKGDDWRWKTPDGEPMNKMDGVIELVWIL